ncbi:hypothetical protein B0H19DRAFT_1083826 [Mycena capillaripes]|nr:hypothetical protein B0H19DRAFT_1083826 [Mycena capillaripes]
MQTAKAGPVLEGRGWTMQRKVVSHPLLRPKDGSELNPVDSGSVSDGDAIERTDSPPPSSPRGKKRRRAAPETASPPQTPSQSHGSGSAADPFLISSSPVVADEEEDDSNAEWVKKRIVELEAGLAVLKPQVNHPKQAKIFLNSMKAQNIGRDLATMGSDVHRFTETGTTTKKATPESLCTGGNSGKMFAESEPAPDPAVDQQAQRSRREIRRLATQFPTIFPAGSISSTSGIRFPSSPPSGDGYTTFISIPRSTRPSSGADGPLIPPLLRPIPGGLITPPPGAVSMSPISAHMARRPPSPRPRARRRGTCPRTRLRVRTVADPTHGEDKHDDPAPIAPHAPPHAAPRRERGAVSERGRVGVLLTRIFVVVPFIRRCLYPPSLVAGGAKSCPHSSASATPTRRIGRASLTPGGTSCVPTRIRTRAPRRIALRAGLGREREVPPVWGVRARAGDASDSDSAPVPVDADGWEPYEFQWDDAVRWVAAQGGDPLTQSEGVAGTRAQAQEDGSTRRDAQVQGGDDTPVVRHRYVDDDTLVRRDVYLPRPSSPSTPSSTATSSASTSFSALPFTPPSAPDDADAGTTLARMRSLSRHLGALGARAAALDVAAENVRRHIQALGMPVPVRAASSSSSEGTVGGTSTGVGADLQAGQGGAEAREAAFMALLHATTAIHNALLSSVAPPSSTSAPAPAPTVPVDADAHSRRTALLVRVGGLSATADGGGGARGRRAHGWRRRVHVRRVRGKSWRGCVCAGRESERGGRQQRLRGYAEIEAAALASRPPPSGRRRADEEKRPQGDARFSIADADGDCY